MFWRAWILRIPSIRENFPGRGPRDPSQFFVLRGPDWLIPFFWSRWTGSLSSDLLVALALRARRRFGKCISRDTTLRGQSLRMRFRFCLLDILANSVRERFG